MTTAIKPSSRSGVVTATVLTVVAGLLGSAAPAVGADDQPAPVDAWTVWRDDPSGNELDPVDMALGVDGTTFVASTLSDVELGIVTTAITPQGTVAWVRTWQETPYPLYDARASAVAVGPTGTVVVAGRTSAPYPEGYLGASSIPTLLAYRADGTLLWQHRYVVDAFESGEYTDVAVSPSGRVYATGELNSHLVVVALDPSGGLLWSRYYVTPYGPMSGHGTSVTVDDADHVYVTGITGWLPRPGFPDGTRPVTIALAEDATPLWKAVYDSGAGYAMGAGSHSIATDGHGNVSVLANDNIFTIGVPGKTIVGQFLAYGPDGQLRWPGIPVTGGARGLAVDGEGRIAVSGGSGTTLYTPAGSMAWHANAAGPSVAFDAASNLYVSAWSGGTDGPGSYAFSVNGTPLWHASHDGILAVQPHGDVTVAYATPAHGTGVTRYHGFDLVVAPTTVDLGDVELGSTATAFINVGNAGSPGLLVAPATVSGPASFTVTGPPAVPYGLPTAGIVQAQVVFTPTTAGPAMADVVFVSNDPDRQITRIPVTANAVRHPQTITLDPVADTLMGTAPFPVRATTTSGLPALVTSASRAVCTVTDGLVTLLSAGTCTLQAAQDGDASWAPAPPVSVSFVVGYQISRVPARTETFTPGSVVPVTFWLLDASGAPIPDATAAALACAVTVRFDAQPPVCAAYHARKDTFTARLTTLRPLRPGGVHTITVTVTAAATTVAREQWTVIAK